MIRVRTYGESGPLVVVLHGGPGAPGHMAPVARRLASAFRVLEPLQRGSADGTLTVQRHIDDLDEVLAGLAGDETVSLLGSSWGAMLALCYAAQHPGRIAGIILVGCGTFDLLARQVFRATLEGRMDAALRKRLGQLDSEVSDLDERLRLKNDLLLPLYSHDLLSTTLEFEEVDAAANRESWDDMLRLQAAGKYPAAFAAIDAPVLMLHGARDPHPGALIRASLTPFIPHLEYHQWEPCGHYPWLEREVREDFFERVERWLKSSVTRFAQPPARSLS